MTYWEGGLIAGVILLIAWWYAELRWHWETATILQRIMTLFFSELQHNRWTEATRLWLMHANSVEIETFTRMMMDIDDVQHVTRDQLVANFRQCVPAEPVRHVEEVATKWMETLQLLPKHADLEEYYTDKPVHPFESDREEGHALDTSMSDDRSSSSSSSSSFLFSSSVHRKGYAPVHTEDQDTQTTLPIDESRRQRLFHIRQVPTVFYWMVFRIGERIFTWCLLRFILWHGFQCTTYRGVTFLHYTSPDRKPPYLLFHGLGTICSPLLRLEHWAKNKASVILPMHPQICMWGDRSLTTHEYLDIVIEFVHHEQQHQHIHVLAQSFGSVILGVFELRKPAELVIHHRVLMEIIASPVVLCEMFALFRNRSLLTTHSHLMRRTQACHMATIISVIGTSHHLACLVYSVLPFGRLCQSDVEQCQHHVDDVERRSTLELRDTGHVFPYVSVGQANRRRRHPCHMDFGR